MNFPKLPELDNGEYVNSWNLFSRSLLIHKFSIKNPNTVYVVENEKIQTQMSQMSEFLWNTIPELLYISDLVELIYNNQGSYFIDQHIIDKDIISKKQFEYKHVLKIKKWEEIAPSVIVEKLIELQYSFAEYEEKWSFSLQGDILRVTPRYWDSIHISFWWETIESFSRDCVGEMYFGRYAPLEILENIQGAKKSFLEIFHSNSHKLLLNVVDFYHYAEIIRPCFKESIAFNNIESPDGSSWDLKIFDFILDSIDTLHENFLSDKREKFIYTKNTKTISNFIELNNFQWIQVNSKNINIAKSFQSNESIVICDDILSKIFIKKRVKRSLAQNMDLLLQMKPWDYVVHIDHWIWIFKEILEKELWEIKKEYMAIEYAAWDKLFVPISEVARVSKYVWSENPKLTPLSTKQWEKKLEKANGEVEELAGELLEIFAKRKLNKWYAFPSYIDEQNRFFQSFDYVYTDDQSQVIREIYVDMESPLAMDRLVSWDVWFWKTEIAFATMYKAIIAGKQAALISPLVVLAYEHFEKARMRFAEFWINVEVVTRFETKSAIENTLKKLKNGKIDLLVWTHRLLSEDIVWKDLWVLVIDEEHKFGVKDKEKIKRLKGNIDILSLSATPIPRSLNMALSGIKSVSLLTTPPVWRQSISTLVAPLEDEMILQAGKREFERGWQVFFIHNRVSTIDAMKEYLSNIFPGKKIVVTHGQLPWDQLERRILAFKSRQYDILLSTTVIENGIDFANVNTIFINEASRFWIGQIHQLRGRVGRSNKKGYCYLLFKRDTIAEDAAKRLKTMVDYSHLWAGFELAVKDLEIRWWGDILGMRQSGQSVEIGVNLYMEMLEDKIEELKNQRFPDEALDWNLQRPKRLHTSIELHLGAYIDDQFFSSELDKLNFYREIESLDIREDLQNLRDDFMQLNPILPQETINFFDLLDLKLLSNKSKVISIKRVGINYQLDFDSSMTLEDMREFLDKDTQAWFVLSSMTRVRTATKNFGSERKFLECMLNLFSWVTKKKITIKKKIIKK